MNRQLYYYIIALLIIVIILTPSFKISSRLPAIRLELIICLFTFLLFFGGQLKNKVIKYNRSSIYKWFFIFTLCMFISMCWAYAIKGLFFNYRDLMEFIKIALYFIIFFVVLNLKIKPDKYIKLYWLSMFCFFLAALFGLAQYLNWLNVNNWLTTIYTAETHMKGLLIHNRITGTAPDPNQFGSLMLIPSFMALSGLLFFKQQKYKLCLFSLFIFFSAILTLSLSRTSLICLVVGITYIVIMRYPYIKETQHSFVKSIFVIVLICITFIIILPFAPENFIQRTLSLKEFRITNSWLVRLDNWKFHWDLFKASPVFGWGPGKSVTLGMFVDNEWLLLLRRYGMFGVTVFIVWFSIIYTRINKIILSLSNTLINVIGITLSTLIIVYPIYMIPLAVFHNMQIMPLFFLYLGLFFNYYDSML